MTLEDLEALILILGLIACGYILVTTVIKDLKENGK